MEVYKFDRTDLENLEDILPWIEEMYKFSLDKKKLKEIENFNDLCELIIASINLENNESCTSQQGFYKLRKVIVDLNIADKNLITPETRLKDIFPKNNRIKLVKNVEEKIGFHLNMIGPPKVVSFPLFIIGLISFVLIFFNWRYGLLGISISIIGLFLGFKFGKEFEMDSIRELVKKITTENYLDLRSNSSTVNKSELKDVLMDWFSDNLGIEKEKLLVAKFG